MHWITAWYLLAYLFSEGINMYLCKECTSELTFRLVINDTEDTKRKKLYLCPKCGKYYFISDEA